MKIELIPVLKDNYAYAIIDESNTEAVIVDPGEAAPVIEFLEARKLNLSDILLTHHHGDHIAGTKELTTHFDNVTVYGPEKDMHRIPFIDVPLSEGDTYSFGAHEATITETPGHTTGHICFYFESLRALFCGDTLFSMGCGRLFEGTAEQMWNSLQKIMALPDDTLIYCGHEYTLSGGSFCLTIEPENPDLHRRIEEARALREDGKPTLPVTLATEKKTNVFLRAGSASEFARIRKQKDAA